ncbi:MAG: CPBP family intramembrane metalloprotease [Planctomycetes bacterium]|nr:CPBP family intramembrane metalloprotease [Planctomycetota bacterium]
MDPVLQSTLIKLLGPLVACVVLLFVAKKRGIKLRDASGLGLRLPTWTAAAFWLAAWIAWMALSEVALAQFGMEQPKPWPEYSAPIFWMRVAAIGLVGPVLEELVFRGAVLSLIERTRFGLRGAILVTSVAWAAIHVQYAPAFIFLIFLDGIFLGECRVRSGSLILPMAMHSMGNLYSIWQSTHS